MGIVPIAPYQMRNQGTQRRDSETPDLRYSILVGLLALSESLPLPTSPHDTPQRDRSRPRTPQKKQAEAKPDRRPPGAPRTGPPLTDVLPYIQRH
ncbi:hypothetical protein CFIO01_04447 [Colletotrichum fioriniae PJ7]|uniref:Uncharacterized protein n=1 Tax=Colletotrichum fioriniae PJ7 TaxID=1445577 RepID=A0A010QE12_9PEZI|nr:hypothetical protein CFIO01_04447 [Colletotrichum fioriniae PJ7]